MKKLLAILALVLLAPLASACDVQRIVLRSYAAPLAIETGCDCYGGAAVQSVYSNRILFNRVQAVHVAPVVQRVVQVQRVQRVVQVQRVRTVRTVERIRIH